MAFCNALGWIVIDYHSPHSLTTFVIFTVVILIGYWVLWHYYQGKNWTRILVLLNCLVSIVGVLRWNPRSPTLLKVP